MLTMPKELQTIDTTNTDLSPFLGKFVRSAENGFTYFVMKKQEYREMDKDYKGILSNGDKSIMALVDHCTTLIRVKLA